MRLGITLLTAVLFVAQLQAGISISLRRSDKFVTTNSPITIKMSVTGDEKNRIRWRLVNESGAEVESGCLATEREHSFIFRLARNGCYRLEVSSGKGKAEALFGVFPPMSKAPIRDGMIGASGVVDRLVDLAKICGVTWNRRHCSRPGPTAKQYFYVDGQYQWPNLQSAEKFEKEHGFLPLGSLDDWTSGWRNEMQNDFVKYLCGYEREYVVPIVKGTQKWIRYWEIGNEPYYPYAASPQKYVELLKRSYWNIKKIDSEIKVVGTCGPPGLSMGEKWYNEVFSRGGLDFQDIVSFHQYSYSNSLDSNPEVQYLEWFKRLRLLIKKYSGKELPIWNTETSLSPPATMYTLPENLKNVQYKRGENSPSPREQAAVMTRILTGHYAANVKYFFHLFNDGPVYLCHPCEFDGTPVAMAISMAATHRMLEGAKPKGLVSIKDAISSFVFEGRDGKTIAVTWLLSSRGRDNNAKLLFPEKLMKNRVYDIFMNHISENLKQLRITYEPVFIIFENANADDAAAQLNNSTIELRQVEPKDDSGISVATPADWNGFYAIDINAAANTGFIDDGAALNGKGGFTDQGNNDLRNLPTGERIMNEVPFHIITPEENGGKQCIVLFGNEKNAKSQKYVISINDGNGKRLSRLHFLHLATWAWWDNGKTIGKYTIYYSDGRKETIPIVIGKNIQNWAVLKPPVDAVAAWNGANPYCDQIALWHYTWNISHSDGAAAVMTKIEIQSTGQKSNMVLVAATGVLSNQRNHKTMHRSFSFLHSFEYTGRYYNSLIQAGLVRPWTGIRLISPPFGCSESHLHNVAKIGSFLESCLKRQGGPFVIDRLCGGCPSGKYYVGDGLVSMYGSTLGDQFMGFQIHEPVSNIENNWRRILRACPETAQKCLDEAMLRDAKFERSLSYGNSEDYLGKKFPASLDAIWDETDYWFKKELARVDGVAGYCEGTHCGELCFAHFYNAGAKWCLLECGPWASDRMQFGIASLRGAAKSCSAMWGVYYAPWGPDGCTCMVPFEQNSWQVAEEFFPPEWKIGATFGPSTSLQRRIFFYAYLAGAKCLYDEWGCESTFVDFDTPRLTCNGKVTKEFLDFVEAYPDCGEPYTPVALVLDMSIYPPTWLDHVKSENTTRMGYLPRKIDNVWADIKSAIFLNNELRCETSVIGLTSLPDIYDIIPSGTPAEVLNAYRNIICVTESTNPLTIVEGILNETPFIKHGNLPMQINYRAKDNTWILAVYNPDGAIRGDIMNSGAELDMDCTACMQVVPKSFAISSIATIYHDSPRTEVELDNNTLSFIIGPGGMIIVEVELKNN